MIRALRFLLGMLYLAVPIVGWIFFYLSLKRVNPGEISIVKTWDKAEILTPGLYFYPLPWESFGKTFSNTLNYINFGALIRVRILPGQVGVKVDTNNKYVMLTSGEHIIDSSAGELFDEKTGFQNPSSANYVLGTQETVTITEDQIALIDTPAGVEIVKQPGKHTFDREEKRSLREIINTGSQVLPLPPLTVQCIDRINMKAEAMLTYKVTTPVKTISLGMATIIANLKKLGDATLRTILSQHTSADIAPSPHDTEFHNGSTRITTLKGIHDQFLKDLAAKAADWGIEISDLVITEILPSDPDYQKTIQTLGVKQATAEAEQTLQETQAKIDAIKAKAEQSRVIAAEKERDEAIIRTETSAKSLLALAQAESEALEIKSKAEAERIKLLAAAKAEELRLLNDATKDATDLTKELARLQVQRDTYKDIKAPVFIPQPELGQVRVYTRENGQHSTMFTSGPPNLASGVTLSDMLNLQAASLLERQPGRGDTAVV